ncbi:MAG: 3-deoxy-manno-octulosonate cytidylyltransferase [Sedimentisphaerales bacterium]|nr:3-deoxy-manno-octulosonate cytidylyltransferase [Sedimentisphaerales bacterium]
MKVVVVIPARYGSTRFGGKVLARDTGHYLVEHTWAQARKAKNVDSVLIATDSNEVLEACREFGASCVMTSEKHQSGTDRIAEAVEGLEADIIVNVQADEPEIDPEHIDFLVSLLTDHPDASMATLVTHFESPRQVFDPNVVKCIIGRNGRAIYFSRSVIPYERAAGGVGSVEQYHRHLGIYAFRRNFLLKYTTLPQTPLELAEKLEQLRAIEHGYSIMVGKVAHSCEGIDTPEQYEAFVKRWKERGKVQ